MRRSTPILAALLVLLMACGGDDGADTLDGTEPAATLPQGSSEAGALAALLEFVPDSAEGRAGELYFSDLAAVRGGRAAATWEDDITLLVDGSGGSLPLPQRYQDCLTDDPTSQLGWDTRNVTAALSAGAAPAVLDVLAGDFTAADVEAALRGSPGGESLVVDTSAAGVIRMSVGDESSIDIRSRSCYRPLGESVSLAIGPAGLLSADTQAEVSAALAAAGGASLADDPSYASVARVLDDAGVHMAMVQAHGWDGTSWSLAAIGEVVDGDDDFTTPDPTTVTVVLVFDSGEGAAAGMDALSAQLASGTSARTGGRWSDDLTVVSVVVDGNAVVAMLTAGSPGWARLLATQETLLTL